LKRSGNPDPSGEGNQHQNRSQNRSKAHIPASRESIFRLPKSPTWPILSGNHGVIAQNKPNPPNPKTNATSYTKNSYPNIPLRPARKNKPKQTQFIAAQLPSGAGLVAAKPLAKPDLTPPKLQAKSRQSRDPDLSGPNQTQSLAHKTPAPRGTYDIRYTTYETSRVWNGKVGSLSPNTPSKNPLRLSASNAWVVVAGCINLLFTNLYELRGYFSCKTGKAHYTLVFWARRKQQIWSA